MAMWMKLCGLGKHVPEHVVQTLVNLHLTGRVRGSGACGLNPGQSASHWRGEGKWSIGFAEPS
eukprot:6789496-Ditylum_brightwellii.AAC.1